VSFCPFPHQLPPIPLFLSETSVCKAQQGEKRLRLPDVLGVVVVGWIKKYYDNQQKGPKMRSLTNRQPRKAVANLPLPPSEISEICIFQFRLAQLTLMRVPAVVPLTSTAIFPLGSKASDADGSNLVQISHGGAA
jgi:hypothetical protein